MREMRSLPRGHGWENKENEVLRKSSEFFGDIIRHGLWISSNTAFLHFFLSNSILETLKVQSSILAKSCLYLSSTSDQITPFNLLWKNVLMRGWNSSRPGTSHFVSQRQECGWADSYRDVTRIDLNSMKHVMVCAFKCYYIFTSTLLESNWSNWLVI